MGEIVHVIPVGFDYERLLHPISKGDLGADRIRLIDSDRSDADPAIRALANRWLEELDYAFSSHLDLEVVIDSVDGPKDPLYDYKQLYKTAYDIITEELQRGNTVWINISSMPRTVAFAFATAANAFIIKEPNKRENIHTYYVKPEKYFSTDMYGELQTLVEALERWTGDVNNFEIKNEMEDRLHTIKNLVNNIERKGFTEGAQRMSDDRLHVEFPAAPLSNLREFEREILRCLKQNQPMKSTSALARELGVEHGIDKNSEDYESFRSKVQYNVDKLEDKGYIVRTKVDNRKETKLSVMGDLWVETNPEPPA